MEQVVLLDAAGNPIGAAPKRDVHTAHTPLHLAFSCWVLGPEGLLLTRRALSKLTWPGVWTNSFCGHPAPGEAVEDAILRRAHTELGFGHDCFTTLDCILPEFQYRAADSSGVVENEICPVYVARLHPDSQLAPNPAEVDSVAWVAPEKLIAAADATPFAFSPWLVAELADQRLRDAITGTRMP